MIGVAVVGSVFNNHIASGLAPLAGQLPPAILQGQTNAIATLPTTLRAAVIGVYVAGLHSAFLTALPFPVLVLLMAPFIKQYRMVMHHEPALA